MEVRDYKFKEFTVRAIDSDLVNEYQFSEFEEGQILCLESKVQELKIEREYSEKNDFQLSPIVRQYRGHQKQESEERKQKIQEEVARKVELLREEVERKGYEDGVIRGREEVYEQTKEEASQKIEILTHLIGDVLSLKEKIFKQQKDELVDLLKVVAKWVTLKELKNDDNYLERLLEKLIHEMQSKNNLQVKVSANDFKQMPEVLAAVEEKLGGLDNVRLEIDQDNLEGGIILQSDNGIIKASIQDQFNEIDRLFTHLSGNENEE